MCCRVGSRSSNLIQREGDSNPNQCRLDCVNKIYYDSYFYDYLQRKSMWRVKKLSETKDKWNHSWMIVEDPKRI